jgi:DNA-binding transcriptional ArsR family regulator
VAVPLRTDDAGAVFAALADPTRREVVRLLAADGPLTATQLAERIPVSRQAIAKHFVALEEAGLATATRVGRESRYELRTEPFAEAEGWMRAIGASWDRRLQAFKRFVDSGERADAGAARSAEPEAGLASVPTNPTDPAPSSRRRTTP